MIRSGPYGGLECELRASQVIQRGARPTQLHGCVQRPRIEFDDTTIRALGRLEMLSRVLHVAELRPRAQLARMLPNDRVELRNRLIKSPGYFKQFDQIETKPGLIGLPRNGFREPRLRLSESSEPYQRQSVQALRFGVERSQMQRGAKALRCFGKSPIVQRLDALRDQLVERRLPHKRRSAVLQAERGELGGVAPLHRV